MREACHETAHIVQFHLYKMSKTGNSIYGKEISGCPGIGRCEGNGSDC